MISVLKQNASHANSHPYRKSQGLLYSEFLFGILSSSFLYPAETQPDEFSTCRQARTENLLQTHG
jgi:hypothetical protein